MPTSGRRQRGFGKGLFFSVWALLAWSLLAVCAEEPGGGVLHLEEDLIPAGATLHGSVRSADLDQLLRLVWLDNLGRVVSHVEIRPKSDRETQTFTLDGRGAQGTNHRLVLLSAQPPKARKVEPHWRVLARTTFRVMQEGHRPAYPIFVGDRQLQAELAGLSAGPILPAQALNDTPFLPPSLPLMVHAEIPLHSPLRVRSEEEWAAETSRFLMDRKPGLRAPDLFDATAWAQMRADLSSAARQAKPFGPTAFMLGSTISLAVGARPFEYGPDAMTLDLFRAWLRRRYEDLSHLNRQWGTNFERWDDVAPLTTDETKAQRDPQYAAWLELVRQGDPDGKLPRHEGRPYWAANLKTLPPPGNENFSSWCDWHAFLDFAFARMVGEARSAIQKSDPSARVGVQNVALPSPWNGQELYALARVADWTAASRDETLALLLQSFRPDGIRYTLADGGADGLTQLWKSWFEGASGAFLNPPAGPRGTAAPLPINALRELDWLTAFRQSMAPVHDAVALYYSPRSIAIHWMLDSQLDGSDWPLRGGEETLKDTPLRNYAAWVALLGDLGVAPRFVAPAQLLAGPLDAKVLILPKVLALSEKEAQAIRDFTLRGGIVIADSQCGTFDEHGRRRPLPVGGGTVGILDTEFGVRRENLWAHELNGTFNGDPKDARVRLLDPCKPVEMGPSSSELRVNEPGLRGTAAWRFGRSEGGAAAVLTRNGGTGRFIYLNLALHDYPQLREQHETDFSFAGLEPKRYAQLYGQPTGGEALRTLLGDMLSQCIGEQVVSVRDAEGRPIRYAQRVRWASNDTVLIGLRPPPGGWPHPSHEPAKPWIEETPAAGHEPATESTAEKAPSPAIKLLFNRKLHWYDLRRNQYAGYGSSCPVAVEGDEPVVLAGLPYRLEVIHARVRRIDPTGSFTVELSFQADRESQKTKSRNGLHVLQVVVLGPNDEVLPQYASRITVTDGTWKGTVFLGINEPAGRYRWRARDLVSGLECEAHLLKEQTCYDKLFPPQRPERPQPKSAEAPKETAVR